MDPLELPSVEPGRSALPAFLRAEAPLQERFAAAREAARRRVDEAEADAARIRREGEARLRQILLDAQEAARREAEDRARDRVSSARIKTQHWVDQAEAALQDALDDALNLCCEP
ncbi:MAG: V-type ATPase subunit subunit G family protein [Planctomycetota bacterium]|jgi:vacuolar-type H+-ATPase subunit H